MKITDLVLEGRSTPCVVVDVQPEYSKFHQGTHRIFRDIIKFVSRQLGPILMLVNARESGMSNDSILEIKYYWEEQGFNPSQWQRVTVVDKGYGYLRNWMDQGVSARTIIKTIRLMYQQRINDSRELFGGAESPDYQTSMEKLLGDEFDQDLLENSIVVNWISIAQLKKFNHCYLMGGYRDECLREVELIMNAFNIKYKRINDLVY